MSFIPEIEFDTIGILFLVFCLLIVLQLTYTMFFPLRVLMHKSTPTKSLKEGVSIVICARNEEDNLHRNLPKVLEQDYPEFEVIIVIDQSMDGSIHIVKALQLKYKHLKFIELERNRHRKFGKKLPLTVGIKGAKYDKILLTDADCYPASDQWIKLMMSNYSDEKRIVLGYGPYERKKGWINKLIRFDTTSIASSYMSFAKNRMPYMGVGRNMSYSKDLFFKVDGFRSHYHIQSGDDDLFMQEVARGKNVAIELRPKSFVYSHPKNNLKDWVKQKQRHFTTAHRYRLINKLFLGIFPGTLFLTWLCFFTLLFSFEWWMFLTSLLVLRYLVVWLVNGLLYKKLGQKDLIWMYPVFELIHLIIMPFIYYSTDRDPDKW